MPLWPIHPKPYADELLSSWVTRLAAENRMTAAEFCRVALPDKRATLREIDRTCSHEMMQVLSEGTGIAIEGAWETSLLFDEGYVFLYQAYGVTDWVFPTVGIDGQVNMGLAYCPLCLKSDAEPYYRKSWRYAFNPICPVHRVYLKRGCPVCSNPHSYFALPGQYPGANPITVCSHCKADIGAAPTYDGDNPDLIERTLQIQQYLDSGLDTDAFKVDGYGFVRAIQYLRLLHSIMHSLGISSRAEWVSRHYREELPKGIHAAVLERNLHAQLIEHRSMEELSVLLCMSMVLMRAWPDRFLDFCHHNKGLSLHVITGKGAPYWLRETADQLRTTKASKPCNEEVESARKLLRGKLRRRESPQELRAFMRDGIARHLAKIDKEKRRDVQLSPKHFKLEAPSRDKRFRLGRHQAEARRLIGETAEQLAKIAVLRKVEHSSERDAPVQHELFTDE